MKQKNAAAGCPAATNATAPSATFRQIPDRIARSEVEVIAVSICD
ncbi:MAG: hypothetical protein ABL908_16870 [Hyphomicrobium sp.]